MDKVLVTGISGFLGSHTAKKLIEQGYAVVGTVRNPDQASAIRNVIAPAAESSEQLVLRQASLTDKRSWQTVMEGIDYVLHIASPFPQKIPKHEDELIIPAKEGTLNILEAAVNAAVKKIVMTSSTGAVYYGKAATERKKEFSEKDWTDTGFIEDTTPYYRSKTIAERAAWDFMENKGAADQLVTICPGAIIGPVLGSHISASINIVKKLMEGAAPALPKIGFEMVDVRSVADLHLLAMQANHSGGERYLATNGYYTFSTISSVLQSHYPDRKFPKQQLPDWFVRIFSNIDTTLKPILVDLGTRRTCDNSKAMRMGWQPIATEQAIIDCAEALLKKGIVR